MASMDEDEEQSSYGRDPIANVADVLLYCDFFARYGIGDVVFHMKGIGRVVRQLARQVEEQAMEMERREAKNQ